MAFRLVHRTNFDGDWIEARHNPRDDLPFPVVWTQALMRGRRSCCRGFGRIEVDLHPKHFQNCRMWQLWFMEANRGRVPGHVFYGFVLTHDGMEQDPGDHWTLVGEIRGERLLLDVRRRLERPRCALV